MKITLPDFIYFSVLLIGIFGGITSCIYEFKTETRRTINGCNTAYENKSVFRLDGGIDDVLSECDKITGYLATVTTNGIPKLNKKSTKITVVISVDDFTAYKNTIYLIKE